MSGRKKQTAAEKRAARAKETPTRKGKNGGELKSGNPGNKGGTGRPPHAFRRFCQDVLANKKTQDAVKAIMESDENGQFSNMFGKLALFAYGPPKSEGSEDSDVQVVMDC